MNKKYLSYISVAGVLAISAIAVPAFAQTDANQQSTTSVGAPSARHGEMGRGMMGHGRHGVFGTVSAINGNSITLTSKMPMPPTSTSTTPTATTTTYTIDATNATVTKDTTASSVSAIAVGDTLMVEGTVTGTTVTATKIHDGMPKQGQGKGEQGIQNPIISGNGQPVVAGAVTSISGNTIMITNKSNVTYTVDATNAKIAKGNTLGALATIAVGDTVIAQGTVNGNTVTAVSVVDQGQMTATSTTNNQQGQEHPQGFLHSVGSFFSRMFGF